VAAKEKPRTSNTEEKSFIADRRLKSGVLVVTPTAVEKSPGIGNFMSDFSLSPKNQRVKTGLNGICRI
jgi:hypothetical protein